jgi:polyisoprenyl-phosphate glycosyltransferase
MRGDPEVSVVVPVFNAAATLRPLVSGIDDAMNALGVTHEIVLVDDGSTDDSWAIIQSLGREHSHVRGCRLARNAGQQAATYCGLLEARGAWVITMDDDLQTPPGEIRALWACAQSTGADVVFGVSGRRRHGLGHRLGTWVLRQMLRRVAPDYPDGSSFRLIRAGILSALPTRPGPWILVDAVLAWHTTAVATVAVAHEPRTTGRSGYSMVALVSIACTLLFAYSRVPLRMMTALGLLAATTSFGLGIFYVVRRLTVGAQLGFSALIVTITFSSGVILLCLGILGEYISRIHTMGSGEPAYVVKART